MRLHARAAVLLLLLLLLLQTQVQMRASAQFVPVVLMHGIDAASASMAHVQASLEAAMPGVFVYAVQIGSNHVYDSIFMNMRDQVADMANKLRAIPELQGGFNLFGVSQGGMNTRGYIEMFGNQPGYPPVNNYVSWVAVQAGVSGIPGAGFATPLVDQLLRTEPYNPIIQELVAPAGYWRDPYNITAYNEGCDFLPELDNTFANKNASYKKSFSGLTHVTLLYSLVDTVLIPKETGWFAVYEPDREGKLYVVPVQDRELYRHDWIGLRALNESQRVSWGTTTCEHSDYSSTCFDEYFAKWVIPLFKLPMSEPAPPWYPRHD